MLYMLQSDFICKTSYPLNTCLKYIKEVNNHLDQSLWGIFEVLLKKLNLKEIQSIKLCLRYWLINGIKTLMCSKI